MKAGKARRIVLEPKYRDPASGKTWNGHGKRPGWIVAAQAKGKLDDLLIEKAGRGKAAKASPAAKPAVKKKAQDKAAAAKPAAKKPVKRAAKKAVPPAPARAGAAKAPRKKSQMRKAAPAPEAASAAPAAAEAPPQVS